jgi:serine/threonine protein kinase
MEHFLLGDLQRYLEEPLPELESRKITLQVLGALFDMHQNAFAHRDIKPKVSAHSSLKIVSSLNIWPNQNILVSSMPPTGPWLVKLSDFGISKRIEESTTATKSWTRAGTDGYMAPELFGFGRPYERPDPQAADMWALGVVAHQMLTAKPCFENLALLSDYGRLPDNFPAGALRERGISDDAVHFIKSIMQFQAGDRLTADQALLHEWVNRSSIEAAEDSSDTHIQYVHHSGSN